MPARPLASGKRHHLLFQATGVAASEQHANLQSLRGIGLSDAPGPGDRLTLAALKDMFCHASTSFAFSDTRSSNSDVTAVSDATARAAS
jgi:hypothetical protein